MQRAFRVYENLHIVWQFPHTFPLAMQAIIVRLTIWEATRTLEADTMGRNRTHLNRRMQFLRSRSLTSSPELRLSLLSAQSDCAPRDLQQKLPTFNSTKFFIWIRFGNIDLLLKACTPFLFIGMGKVKTYVPYELINFHLHMLCVRNTILSINVILLSILVWSPQFPFRTCPCFYI